MARITLLEPEQLDREIAEMTDAGQRAPLELGTVRIYGHRPEAAKAYLRFAGTLRNAGLLPRRLIELVRLRVAYHNQCRSCMAIRYQDGIDEGVDEQLICQLVDPPSASDLSDQEKAAIRFADLLATNHLAISDETIADLSEHFSEPEIVELGMNVATFVGFGRLAMAWDMVDELPEEYRDRSGAKITPWSGDPVVV